MEGGKLSVQKEESSCQIKVGDVGQLVKSKKKMKGGSSMYEEVGW